MLVLKDQGWAGGQLSETLARRISGHTSHAISPGSFPLDCRISEESARKQRATASLFSRSGAVCSSRRLHRHCRGQLGPCVEPSVSPTCCSMWEPLQQVPGPFLPQFPPLCGPAAPCTPSWAVPPGATALSGPGTLWHFPAKDQKPGLPKSYQHIKSEQTSWHSFLQG